MSKTTKPALVRVLDGEVLATTPIWLMRQEGRYLPEYRATRARAGSFLDLCYRPDLATEVTLQPIRRFNFDAAILFSDILVVADALGRGVRFEDGVGPLMEPLDLAAIARLDDATVGGKLDPVIETVARVRAELDADKGLIGFCGGPWTVATYMLAGRSSGDQAPARLFAYREPQAMERLIDMLVSVSSRYLLAQLKAGADAVQIFDSWAGVLDEDQYVRWCEQPVREIVEKVRAELPAARIIGFPRGAGYLGERYRRETGVTAVGLDWTVPLAAARRMQREGPVQGNLDPLRLVAGGQVLDEGIDRIMDALGKGAFVFNLGHGITPETPIEHVERLVRRVRGR